MKLVGFLHSDTAGSQDRDSYPTNIAAMCVLLRYFIPRHPLSAFCKNFPDALRHLVLRPFSSVVKVQSKYSAECKAQSAKEKFQCSMHYVLCAKFVGQVKLDYSSSNVIY